MVCKKGALIGYFVGEVIIGGPPDHAKNKKEEKDNLLVVFHDKEEGGGVQYLLDTRHVGSVFRWIRYTCKEHTVARFKKRRVSGCWRMAIMAVQDVQHGQKITAFDKGYKDNNDSNEFGGLA